MHCTLAKVTDNALNEIKTMESKTGKVVLAYSCHQAKIAQLKPEEIAELQVLEGKLGLTLVALEV